MFRQLLICEYKLFFRNFINAFFCLLFPPAMIVLFGGIYGNSPSIEYDGKGMVDVSLPAYFALIISVTAIMSIPMTLSEYREKRILKKYMTTPLRKMDILFSIITVNIFSSVMGMVLLYLVARSLFAVVFEGNVFVFLASMLLSICAMYSLGLLLSNLGRSIKTTNTLCYSVYFPMLFLSGATIPKELFPNTVLIISKFVPLSYVVDVLKHSWMGNSDSGLFSGICFLLILFVVCSIINQKFFRWE